MNRESAYELLKRGEELLRSRNPAQAAVVLERARRQEPGKPSIREALGRAYYDSGRTFRAMSEFSYLIEHYPTNSYAHYCLARCAERLGDEILSSRHYNLASAMGYKAAP
ncbi:MAG: tetratricopeptide repeat protein [Actinomycetota bacterium]